MFKQLFESKTEDKEASFTLCLLFGVFDLNMSLLYNMCCMSYSVRKIWQQT